MDAGVVWREDGASRLQPGMTVKNCGAEAKNPTQLWIT
jgi:hypothetical protein